MILTSSEHGPSVETLDPYAAYFSAIYSLYVTGEYYKSFSKNKLSKNELKNKTQILTSTDGLAMTENDSVITRCAFNHYNNINHAEIPDIVAQKLSDLSSQVNN